MPLPKYINYHALNALLDPIYAVTKKSLYKKPDVIRSDKSRRDVRKTCAFHKDIGHNTERCIALKDKIERLIRAGYFKEFLESEPHVANRNKRPRQQCLEKIREVLTIFRGPHVARDSHSACDRYVKEARSPS